MYIKFDSSGKNTGSCHAFVRNYMDKENDQGLSNEQWFGHTKDEVSKYDVQYSIDRDHQGVGKKEGKYTTGSINITEDEWKALGKNDVEREQKFKEFAKNEFTNTLANNYTKKNKAGEHIPIEKDNINIYFKMERNRQYKGTDEEVKQGIAKQGENKQGFNHHIHFIIARKTIDGRNRISPTTKNSKEFSRDQFFDKVEQGFDLKTGYNRNLEESYQYKNTMKHGTFEEKNNLIDKKNEQDIQLIRQNLVQDKIHEQVQQQQLEQKQERSISKGLQR